MIKFFGFLLFFFMAIFIFAGTIFSSSLIERVMIDNVYDFKRFLATIYFSILFAFILFKFNLVVLNRSALLFFLMFFAVNLVSSVLSANMYWSFIELSVISMMFLACWSLASVIQLYDRQALLRGLFYFSIAFSLAFSIQFWLSLLFHFVDGKQFGIHDLVPGYVNVRFFNDIQVFVAPMLLLPLFDESIKRHLKLACVLFSFHWLALLQSEARGAILSLLLTFAIMCFFLDRERRNVAFKFSVAAVTNGAILWFLFIIILPTLLLGETSAQFRTTSSGRIELWLYVLTQVKDNLFFGFGPMAFAWADGKPLPNAHPHNLILQALYEQGIVGCCILVFYLHKLLRFTFSSAQLKEQLSGEFCVRYSMVAALVYSLFCGIAVMPFSQLLLCFIFAIECAKIKGRKLPCRYSRIVGSLGLACAGFVLSSYAHPDIISGQWFPRLWRNGLIAE